MLATSGLLGWNEGRNKAWWDNDSYQMGSSRLTRLLGQRSMESVFDMGEQDILTRVREAAAKRMLFLPHAVNQMNSPARMITTQGVRGVVLRGVVIEDYPEDARAIVA